MLDRSNERFLIDWHNTVINLMLSVFEIIKVHFSANQYSNMRLEQTRFWLYTSRFGMNEAGDTAIKREEANT